MRQLPRKKRIRERFRKSFKFILKSFVFVVFCSSIILIILGFLLNRAPDFVSPLPLGKYSQATTIDASQIKSELSKKHIDTQGIFLLQEGGYLIKLKDNELVYISAKKSIPSQISSLQLVLSRLTIEGKRFSSLDFRYDTPVIVYK